ncbi:MAG: molybdate ABC transporter substrate-binding protein [Planctomycetota bacterium]|nr:molybdate ABC transporter substrate-binding protein [Planctomycetota bacterium]MDA0918537.1 molybdate ABC transporter substrate-binding protein [Planctomycetota bacterium]
MKSPTTKFRQSNRDSHQRSGRVNALWALLAGGMAIVGVSVFLLSKGGPGHAPEGQTLVMFCAAGIRVPVEEVAVEYEEKYGVHIELQYGGSQTLLSQIKVDEHGTSDLFLAADDFYTDKAHEDGLAKETLSIAYMRPVIAVSKDNPKNIQAIRDLLKTDVRVSLGSPEQAAIGRAVQKRLKSHQVGDSDLWTKLEEHVTDVGVFKPTVNDVANDVLIGAVDAGIVWDSTVAMPKYAEKLIGVPVDELDGDPNLISICVLKSSQQPTAALKFARYLSACDRGLPVFKKYGMRPVDGDIWVENPEITFYCGAINRRAIAQIVDDFSTREGVSVNTIYDGCGILTGRMKTIDGQSPELGFPDVYMACDRYYLDNVKEWFQDAANVSDAEIVIVVPKGSDKVKTPADLIKPGIRVSIGQPEQCTIGALTRRLLTDQGLYEKLKEKQKSDGEVVVEKSSSALLIPDVVSGHADATVAYITDTIATRNDIDIIKIESPLNMAIQPFSIARTSVHKHLVRRLFTRVSESKDSFEKAGFHFRLGVDQEAKDDAPESSPASTTPEAGASSSSETSES